MVLIDNYAAFATYPNYQTTLKADGLHPNDAGYVVLGQSFYSAIAALLPVSPWDARAPAAAWGVSFTGDAAPKTAFGSGTVGSVCLVNLATDQPFGCGPSSSPYCAANSPNKNRGWAGSKLFVLLASMPHVGAGTGEVPTSASCADSSNGWTDAPWIGLSIGELIRAGAFSSCQCYEVTQYHGDGCGQVNAFEVINDNDTSGNYKNLELFSSNFFGYGGGLGGPCGTNTCDTAGLDGAVDLVAKKAEAAQGALASQTPRMALAQSDLRTMIQQVATDLSTITADDATNQVTAAALLIKMNVAPVVTIHLPFSGDNHTDNNFAAEASQTTASVNNIKALMTKLTTYGLQDKVTFATLNVFGRGFDGLNGRGHNASHAVSVMWSYRTRRGT